MNFFSSLGNKDEKTTAATISNYFYRKGLKIQMKGGKKWPYGPGLGTIIFHVMKDKF